MKELLPFTLGLLLGVFGMWMYRYIRRYISRREFEKQRAKFEDSLKEFYKNLNERRQGAERSLSE